MPIELNTVLNLIQDQHQLTAPQTLLYHWYRLSEYDKEIDVPEGKSFYNSASSSAVLGTKRKDSLGPNQDTEDWRNLALDETQLNLNAAKNYYGIKSKRIIESMEKELQLIKQKSQLLLQQNNQANRQQNVREETMYLKKLKKAYSKILALKCRIE